MRAEQGELFEPTGAIVCELALKHAQRAEAFDKSADIAATRGWSAVCRTYRESASRERAEAEALAMLADFERLGGIA